MTLITERPSMNTPRVAADAAVRLVPAAPALWRVLDRRGIVIGHLQAIAQDGATRFRARRFHRSNGGLRDLGDFWNVEDAIDCLRFAR